jgi:DNA-binding NtrC family response regulator
VKDRTLREDLLYRVAVFPIEMPPLRERGGDLEQLAEHFLGQLNEGSGIRKQFSASSLGTLRTHSWPGNVRELRNAVERAYILADRLVELAPLQVAARAPTIRVANGHAKLPIEVGLNLKQAERSLIEATLQYFEGNKTQTAVALGCSLKTLYNKLNGYTRDTAFSH